MLNEFKALAMLITKIYLNTTLVNVKHSLRNIILKTLPNLNTTLVNVKQPPLQNFLNTDYYLNTTLVNVKH